jgi:ABC-type multidrug transport system fused ATPase/permease subunit
MKSQTKQTDWNMLHFFFDVLKAISPFILLIIPIIYRWNINWFVLITVILLVSIIIFVLIQWKRYKKKARKLVAILLPLDPKSETEDSQRKAIVDDSIAQLLGIFKFIRNEGQKTYDDIEYIFINHQNHPSTAKEKVTEEIKKGTKYFFSTMSKVNVELSEFFTGEKDKDGNKIDDRNNPILVCTATSSCKLKTEKNKVYRYYPRSKEEGERFAITLNDLLQNINIADRKVSSIIINSNHGIETVNAFSKKLKSDELKGSKIQYKESEEVKLCFDMNKNKVKRAIEQHSDFYSNKNHTILISHYGQGITDIMDSLRELVLGKITIRNGENVFDYKKKEELPLFLFSSTLKSETWQQPIKEILDHIRYCIAVPQYDNGATKHVDVVKDFSEYAFTKFIKSIIMVKNGRKEDFHSAWTSINSPDDLVENIEYLRDENHIENGDIKITMKIDEENI